MVAEPLRCSEMQTTSAPGPAVTSPPGPASRWRLDARSLALATTAVALVPVVVAVVRALLADQFAIHSDAAIIELRVRDVGSDTPLLGSYQRFGWRQPGPWLFYVLTVPYRLLGSTFAGLQVGALLINAAALVGVALTVLKRFGAVSALWAVALCSVLVHALGIEILSDPWEPRVTVLPFVLLLVLAAALSSGAAWAAPFAVGVGSFLMQAQTTLVPVVAALLALGALGYGWHWWRSARAAGDQTRPPAPIRVPVVATFVVLGVLWLPPLLHELGGEPSNIGRMLEFARDSPPTLGPRDALSALSLQTDLDAGWITGSTPVVYTVGRVDLSDAPAVPLSLLALGLATALAVVRRDRAAAVGATVLAAWGLGLLSLSRLVGELFDWILYWTWGLGAATWLAAGVCGWRALPRRQRRRLDVPVGGLLSLGVLALVCGSIATDDGLSEPEDRVRTLVTELAPEVETALGGTRGPVLVRSEMELEALFTDGDIGVELMALAVERAGHDVRVSPTLTSKVGEHRVGDDAVAEVVMVTDPAAVAAAGDDVVGSVQPLTDEEEAELATLRTDLASLGLADATVEEIPPDEQLLKLRVGRLRQLEDYQPMSVIVRRLG